MPSSGGQTCALRSEEHTSELQSLTNLVCRLLLEKTSGNKIIHGRITKEGPKNLRTVYIQAAWSIIRSRYKKEDPRLNRLRKKFYRISVKEKNAQRAVVAVARHLSRITFGVLNGQKEYDGSMKK